MAEMTTHIYNRKRLEGVAGWREEQMVEHFCAEELNSGKLAIVLGAGVSLACGLPDWTTLTKRCCHVAKKDMPKGRDLEAVAEWLLTKCCKKDNDAFGKIIHEALYRDYHFSGLRLAEKELLLSLAALAFPSARGNVRQIISFNFDDLLEQLLSSFGVCVHSFADLPQLENNADVRIFHPHGYLPYSKLKPCAGCIVMARNQFDQIQIGTPDLRRNALIETMSSYTCLFVGLSGNDTNLTQVMTAVNGRHANKAHGYPYWGIRLGDKDRESDHIWRGRGVFPMNVGSFKKIPAFLQNICKIAAEATSHD
jgi:hypothetical protein